MAGRRQLRASELVELLQAAIERDGDRPVKVEGCDCDGDAGGVSSLEYPVADKSAPEGRRTVKGFLIERTRD